MVGRVGNGLTARSQLTEETIRSWFHEIRSYIDSKDLSNIFDDSRRIYNADETAFFLAPKGIKCLMRKGDKTAYNFISNNDKECLTCLITANVAGTILPPMVMFSYERIPSQIASLMPKSCHLTMELSEFCVNNQIELVALYPNVTHILQPLDVAVFHPLKSGWKKGMQSYKMENDGAKIKKENFSPLLATVLDQSIKSETIREDFKICGLCPLDENAIPYKKHFKSEHNKDKETKAIGKDKIQLFKLENGDSWQGDINDTSLFHLWKKVHNEINLHKVDNLLDSLSEP
ncbi:hypothetical protein ILUMI_19380, partial [Ignelater luminosus]